MSSGTCFGELSRRRSGDRREPEISAQDIDAGLALLAPVVGEAGHGVHAGQAHGGLPVAELLGGGLKALGEEALIVAVALALLDAMTAVPEGESHHGADSRRDREGHLDDFDRDALRGLATGRAVWEAKQPGEKQVDARRARRGHEAGDDDRQPGGPKPWRDVGTPPSRKPLVVHAPSLPHRPVFASCDARCRRRKPVAPCASLA